MEFYRALGVKKGITAIVGSGGKTSLMLRLGRELAPLGRTLLCTTARIYPPEGIVTLTGAGRREVEAALAAHGPVCIGEPHGEKLGPPGIGVEGLAELADYVIVEADGSKGLPLKAHAPYEPVIPAGAHVICVVGAGGIGRPIKEAAHRPELYAAALGRGMEHAVTPEDAAAMIKYGDILLFNQGDIPGGQELGRRFAAACKIPVVIASLALGRIYGAGHSQYMALALEEARQAYREGEAPIGAVIVKDGEVIAAAHNRVEAEGSALCHAELLAIDRAAGALGDWRLEGCTLYVTMEPCPMCLGAILNSRLSGLVFGAYDGEMGCCGSRLELTDGLLPRRVKAVGGVLEEECAGLLREFFRLRREGGQAHELPRP